MKKIKQKIKRLCRFCKKRPLLNRENALTCGQPSCRRKAKIQRDRAYREKPEIKKRLKKKRIAYQARPEVKKRMSAYGKAYRQRPEVKKKLRDYARAYAQKPRVKKITKAYAKAYSQRPEVKERRRLKYQKKKKALLAQIQ